MVKMINKDYYYNNHNSKLTILHFIFIGLGEGVMDCQPGPYFMGYPWTPLSLPNHTTLCHVGGHPRGFRLQGVQIGSPLDTPCHAGLLPTSSGSFQNLFGRTDVTQKPVLESGEAVFGSQSSSDAVSSTVTKIEKTSV
jgi:hypothetical protein